MIEIKKTSLQGAFGTATRGGSLVIPVYSTKDPLIVTSGPYVKEWPPVVIVQENSLVVLHVTKDSAQQVMPYKRLDLYDVQRLGLVKFKEMLNSSKAIYVLESLTYQMLFEIAKKHNHLNFLHKEYLQHLLQLEESIV